MKAYSENIALAKAVSLREAGQLAAALSLLHVACDERPGDAAAWHHLGIGYARSGRFDYAQRCLERAAALAPDCSEITAHLANIFVLKKDMAAAVGQANKLIDLDPANADFRLFLGSLYASTGKLDDALACAYAAVERAPEMAAAHVLLAQLHVARRESAAAMSAASAVLQLEPDNAVARQILQQSGMAPQQP